MKTGDNRLPVLADQINTEHQTATAALSAGVQHATPIKSLQPRLTASFSWAIKRQATVQTTPRVISDSLRRLSERGDK